MINWYRGTPVMEKEWSKVAVVEAGKEAAQKMSETMSCLRVAWLSAMIRGMSRRQQDALQQDTLLRSAAKRRR
jgi:hypothetical protein